jgi:hypothetical protein
MTKHPLSSRRLAARAVASVLLILMSACDGGTVPTVQDAEPDRPIASVPASPAPVLPAASIRIIGDTTHMWAGGRLVLQFEAFDLRGNRVSSAAAEVRVGNAAVARVARSWTYTMTDVQSKVVTSELKSTIDLVSSGSTTIHVTLGAATDSITLQVASGPARTGALVVESFTVLEYRASCVWECPYLVYAPLLELRETTGTRQIEVVAVEFTMPTRTTGLCYTSRVYGPGVRAQVNGVEPYLWSNEMFVFSLDGTPLPDGPATARVIVRDANGVYGAVEATGTIVRSVLNPQLPASPWRGDDWYCK